MRKNKIKIIIISIVAFLVCLSGVSYAYFSYIIVGTPHNLIANTTNLHLVFTNNAAITATNMWPSDTITKTFTVQNTGSETVSYNLYWLDILNTYVNKNELVYTLTSTTTGTNTPPTVSQTQVPSSANTSIIATDINIAVNEIHSYELVITFLETGSNQNANQEAQFNCEIFIQENEVAAYAYTGSPQVFIAPVTGTYKVELWGAQGGSGAGGIAYGGYTAGNIKLEIGDTLYVYVGQHSSLTSGNCSALQNQTFNGTEYRACASGGGATDVRLVGGNWNSDVSLNSRIMVAGAGGGAIYAANQGYAGGIESYPGIGLGSGTGYFAGAKATQTTGGDFGKGGQQSTTSGGGGYYGGNRGAGGDAAGGSSYISGHRGCVAIANGSTSNPRAVNISGCTSGSTNILCSIHYSDEYFTNTVMIDGAGYNWTNVKGSLKQMPNPSGSYYSSGTGHTGNGVAKITLITKNNDNLLANGDFSSYSTSTNATSYPWDQTKNPWPVIIPTSWSAGYNGGVSNPTAGYHGHFETETFGYPVLKFVNKNSEIGQTGRWMGTNTSSISYILPSTTYTLSFEYYSEDVGTNVHGGLYYYNTATSTTSFHNGYFEFTSTPSTINQWNKVVYTFTTLSTLSTLNSSRFYFYAGGSEGTSYIRNVKLELGSIATDF